MNFIVEDVRTWRACCFSLRKETSLFLKAVVGISFCSYLLPTFPSQQCELISCARLKGNKHNCKNNENYLLSVILRTQYQCHDFSESVFFEEMTVSEDLEHDSVS